MPISNKSSENRMTTTTIRLDPKQKSKQSTIQNTQRRPVVFTDTNTYPVIETPPLDRDPTPPNITRGSPRILRVKRVPRVRQSSPPITYRTAPTPEQEIIIKKDTTTRGTPPRNSFYDTFPKDQSVYYPNTYEMRSQQTLPTVRYRTSSPPIIHPTTTTSEVTVHQPQTNATTTTKTSTRVLDDGFGDESIIEETKTTTTVIKPIEIPTAQAVVSSTVATVPQVTTVAPAIETTTIRERPTYHYRRRRPRTLSTLSYYTTSSTSSYTTTSSITPQPPIIKHHIIPPRPPIHTTIINEPPKEVVPIQRYIHHVRRTRTYSGYYSSDLDHGKKKVYKSDYKYRHYYYCNWCKGRCDLPNSSCSCCEWFYGCPLWGLILLALFFLALIITFFTLLGLQPTINPTRRSDTAQTQILNRTQIIYGFLQNCGFQTGTPTTLALCANTQTTSTSIFQLTATYIPSKGLRNIFYTKLILLISTFFIFIN